MTRAATAATTPTHDINPSLRRRRVAALLNAPIPDDVRNNVSHHVHATSSALLAASWELTMGDVGKLGHLAAHLEDAFRFLQVARAALLQAAGSELKGTDLKDFGWAHRSKLSGEEAA